MYEYYMKEEELDMIINKTSRYLSKKKEHSSFEEIAMNICEKYSVDGFDITQKQFNIIARIYYSKVFEFKKPTKKMIKDRLEEDSYRLAKEEFQRRNSMKDIFDYLHPQGSAMEEHF